jgi:7,8-dihydroneopterin aldolase/epimerase/oxygenase
VTAARPQPFPAVTPRPAALRVFMRGLRLDAEIGLHPHERGRAQPLVVDAEVELAPREVAHFADTVNYEVLAEYARALAARGHVELVETYAQDLARALLRETGALAVTVRVQKPQALDGAEAGGVEIRLERPA